MRCTQPFCILALIAACANEPSDIAVEGIVLGKILTGLDTPVPDAWVVLDGLYPLRNGSTIPVFDSTRTDTAGHFRARLAVLNMPDTTISYSMRVWPPPDTGFSPDETVGLGLRLTAAPAQDTTRMNIYLSPPGGPGGPELMLESSGIPRHGRSATVK